ncbi:MAG TPA: autotransporter-associated beta strand repeat-containing protein, partial [Tepidisphaeraceae bacterium]|nr:autotransporter-associated beta strand repeat-containing protein [Tepidisphaeraceae bacterium]
MLRSQGCSGAGSVRTSVGTKDKAARLAKRRWGKATVMALLSAASMALPGGPAAGAADLDWTGATDLNWGTDTNWSPAAVPTDTSDARFMIVPAGSITLGTALANSVFAAENTTLTGGTLTLGAVVPDANSGKVTVDPSRTLTFTNTAVLAGSAGLNKLGTGTLVLQGTANTYTGLTTVGGGTLTIAGNGSLGASTSAVVLDGGGTVNVTSGANNANIAITRNFSVGAAGGGLSSTSTAVAGTQMTTTYSGAIDLSGALNVSAGGLATTVLSGTLTHTGGPHALVKTGDGIVRLQGTGIQPFGGITTSGGALQFAVGTGNTFSQTTGGVTNNGIIQAASGTLDFGTQTVTATGGPGALFTTGVLREGRFTANANNLTSANVGTTTASTLSKINIDDFGSGAGPTNGWGDNNTYAYSGQFFTDGSSPIQFGEAFDDSVTIYVDGVQVHTSGFSAADASASPLLNLAAGWHSIELRFGQGGGGVGAVATTNAANGSDKWGFGTGRNGLGFGYRLATTSSLDGSLYSDFNSTAFQMRTLANQVVVDSGATIKAGAITGGGALVFNGSGTTATTVDLVNTSGTSDVQVLQAIGNGSNNVLNLAPGQSLDVASLQLMGTSRLTLTGGTVNLGQSSDPNASLFSGGGGTLRLNSGSTVNVITGTAGGSGTTYEMNGGTLNSAVNFTIGGLSGSANGVNVTGGAVMSLNGTGVTGTGIATYSGVLSGSFGLNKTGTGTQVLTAVNTFTGPVTIDGGTLQVNSDQALGNAANNITMSGTTGVLAVTADVTTARTLTLTGSNTVSSLSAVAGTTLTLTTGIDGGATNGLVKTDNGTVVLAGAASGTWAGPVTINAGALRVSNSAALGTGPVSISPNAAAPGAALQLTNNVTIANEINLQGTGNVTLGGINFGGQLQSVQGTNVTTGQVRLSFDAAIGADTGSTLNIDGGIHNPTASGRALFFTGGGTINVNSAMTSATATANDFHRIEKWGTGTVNFTSANPVRFTDSFRVQEGTLALKDAGTITGTPAIGVTVHPGATLALDNSATNVTNRLGARPLTIQGGNLSLTGSASAATSETFGATTFSRGHSVITVTAGAGQQADLRFGAVNNPSTAQNAGTAPSGATALFRGTGLGNAVGAGVASVAGSTFTFAGQTGGTGTVTTASANKGILPWALVDSSATGSGTSFATADSTTGTATTSAILRPLNAFEYAADNTVTANNNIRITGAVGTPVNTLTVNSITFASPGSLTINAGQSLSVSSGGVLGLTGTSTITGGVLSAPNTFSPLVFHALGDITVGSTLNGGNGGNVVGLVKAGAGTLTLSSPENAAYVGMSA